MTTVNSLCVYCGSNSATPAYREAARCFGDTCARAGITIVYGGAAVGLMGILADAALAAGGRVIGVLPTFMRDREIDHKGLTELHLVDNLHDRKRQMMERADACVALPGGFGTMEEIFEAMTWAQLRLHAKPCGFLNVNGFYDDFFRFLDHMVAEGFTKPELRAEIIAETDSTSLLHRLQTWRPSKIEKWIR